MGYVTGSISVTTSFSTNFNPAKQRYCRSELSTRLIPSISLSFLSSFSKWNFEWISSNSYQVSSFRRTVTFLGEEYRDHFSDEINNEITGRRKLRKLLHAFPIRKRRGEKEKRLASEWNGQLRSRKIEEGRPHAISPGGLLIRGPLERFIPSYVFIRESKFLERKLLDACNAVTAARYSTWWTASRNGIQGSIQASIRDLCSCPFSLPPLSAHSSYIRSESIIHDGYRPSIIRNNNIPPSPRFSILISFVSRVIRVITGIECGGSSGLIEFIADPPRTRPRSVRYDKKRIVCSHEMRLI